MSEQTHGSQIQSTASVTSPLGSANSQAACLRPSVHRGLLPVSQLHLNLRPKACSSVQPGVLGFGLLLDGNVGIGVFSRGRVHHDESCERHQRPHRSRVVNHPDEATMYLLERGVRLTGTDGWSWDAPFVYTAERYRQTGNAALIWEGHRAGREIGYCHLEKLHNLESLPADGYSVVCFPVKVRSASAGWTRAVAILDSGE